MIAQRSADLQTPYTRFNLAVALMRAGREKAAVSLLYRLGRAPTADAESHAIRDQANLALGWHFLEQKLGGNAKAAFREVRLRGPQSNAALLGLGWAELAPQGQRQYRDYVGDEASAVIVTDLSPALIKRFAERRLIEPELALLYDPMVLPSHPRATLSSDEKTALGRASVAWKALQNRDQDDPFVWESWIALPYALDTAGDRQAATEHYRLAITRLDATERRMQSVIPSLAGMLAEPAALQAAGTNWARWHASAEIQMLASEIREMREQLQRLESLATQRVGTQPLPAVLQQESLLLRAEWSRWATEREVLLQQKFQAHRQKQLELLRHYRQSAHLALARLLDANADMRPPAPGE